MWVSFQIGGYYKLHRGTTGDLEPITNNNPLDDGSTDDILFKVEVDTIGDISAEVESTKVLHINNDSCGYTGLEVPCGAFSYRLRIPDTYIGSNITITFQIYVAQYDTVYNVPYDLEYSEIAQVSPSTIGV